MPCGRSRAEVQDHTSRRDTRQRRQEISHRQVREIGEGEAALERLELASRGSLQVAVNSDVPPTTKSAVSLFRGGAGQTFVPHDVVSRLSSAARAPVYVLVDQYLGLGPVGGYLYSLELHGKASSPRCGLRVLRGESPANIPVLEVADNQYMFDGRQLDRVDTRQPECSRPTVSSSSASPVPGIAPGVHHQWSGIAGRPDGLDRRTPRASRATPAGRVGASREFCAHP